MAQRQGVYACAGMALICSWPACALGQSGGWLVEARPPLVSPATPVSEIRVYAWFDRIPGVAELFRAGNYSVTAGAPLFLDYYTPPGIQGPDPPRPPLPTELELMFAAQMHAPPMFVGSTANPILVLVARWRPSDLTPRTVMMSVLNRPEAPLWVFKGVNGTAYTRIDSPASDTCLIEIVGECYADCDPSSGQGLLDIFDFLCFQNEFVGGCP